MLIRVAAGALALLAASGGAGHSAAHAQDPEPQASPLASGVDTEHIFGFSEGSDIGPRGEWEIESVSVGGWGAFGSHLNAGNETSVHNCITDDLRLSIGSLAEGHGFRRLPAVSTRNGIDFSGIFTEVRWKILDWLTSPIGMTLTIDPEWRRIDPGSGLQRESYGFTAALLLDRELVPERLFGVVNLIYSPSLQRLSSGWRHYDGFVAIAGASYAVAPHVFFGAEIRHENLTLDGALAGHALFVGPQLYVKPVENLDVKIAWAAQIPDLAASTLDLINFERNQLLLQIAYTY